MDVTALYDITREDVRKTTSRLDLMTAAYELLNREEEINALNVPSIAKINFSPQIIVALLLHRLEELGEKIVSDDVKAHFARVRERAEQRRKELKL